MTADHPRTFRTGCARRMDLVAIWGLVAAGAVAVLLAAGYVLNENLMAYALCSTPPRTGCSDGPWYSSITLSFFGGIAVVCFGGVLGVRRHRRGQHGVWYPLGGLVAVGVLTGVAEAILVMTTPL